MSEAMSSKHPPLWLLCLLSLSCLGFGPPVLTDADVPTRWVTQQQLAAVRHTAPPHIEAEAALLADVATGQILYAHNEHERRAPASLTKIVTAMVALEVGRQDQEITVATADLYVDSVAGITTGERLTLRQLLFLLLVPSDNRSAMVIARGLAGDYATFVGWMNDLSARWGMANTHFGNPHGLDNAETYSTAYDIAIAARNAMANPVFADIVRYSEAVIADHWIVSTNELLRTYPGAVGVKTGTTDRAGQCLAAMVDRVPGKALTVVMGSKDRFLDTRLLMDYYYANYAVLTIDLPPTDQNRYLDEEGHWHGLRLEKPFAMLIKPWQVGSARAYRRIDTLSPNPDPSEPVGALEIVLDGVPVAEVPMYAR
jgi:D-alanyl-D-alanine carboxypeptidase (penicillin-binding protein 5/6)